MIAWVLRELLGYAIAMCRLIVVWIGLTGKCYDHRFVVALRLCSGARPWRLGGTVVPSLELCLSDLGA